MKNRIPLAILAVTLSLPLFAEEKSDHPRISFVGPGAGTTSISRDQFVLLVVEGAFLSHEQTPIADAGAVEFINTLLKTKNVSYVGVYTRQGAKYGDVIRAVDLLRKTNAKEIGVSLMELPPGRQP
jgi:biopolymer transport protein ExbD